MICLAQGHRTKRKTDHDLDATETRASLASRHLSDENFQLNSRVAELVRKASGKFGRLVELERKVADKSGRLDELERKVADKSGRLVELEGEKRRLEGVISLADTEAQDQTLTSTR